MSNLQTYGVQGLLILLGLSLPLASCTAATDGLNAQIEVPQSPSPELTVPEATVPERDAYTVVDGYQVAAQPQTHAEPKALALAVFGYGEPAEGNFQETVEVVSQTPDQAVVILTQANLPDDSVRSVCYRIEMVPVAGSSGEWQMDWVGRQAQCWPERGHQDWSKQPCS